MGFDALIVIDMQTALVGRHPCNENEVVDSIGELARACRAAGVPVLYVRHDGGAGDELEAGTPGWEICAELAPLEGERVFEKRFNSAFRQTQLHDHLQRIGARSLVMCGMQTEFCFDVSVKVAFELGYEVTVPKGSVTTFDSDFAEGGVLTAYFEDRIWNGRYARVLPLDEVLAELERGPRADG
ncbi:cysteine hydrolase family protein [Gordonibacter massiliensis (ex Traore et al. 2017)]|uniref:Cysteine hydrolase n=1 Tax=Gordonibacter massiliensis (ex Traore et al. 2017) TaxID=1841863 RepID=A0A842JLY5_9ACTN|nr:cysteine hydrolase family protein [Gordonibacter massiliensis (ex Traore et al. 2017)]MBC2890179.1 cysteine hydrolase [Gordonibacter massiliensis (ex Traore et al. 2017)]